MTEPHVLQGQQDIKFAANRGLQLGGSGGNSAPILQPSPQPLAGNFAAEVDISYMEDTDTTNFYIWALQETGAGWKIAFPTGRGAIEALIQEPIPNAWSEGLPWQLESAAKRSVFYTPVNGRRYTLRMEVNDTGLRILSNGGELFQVEKPKEWNDFAPVALSVGQLYGGSILHRAQAWQQTVPVGTQYTFTYRYEGRKCPARFLKIQSDLWSETSSDDNDCLPTQFYFKEIAVTKDWTVLYDSGRNTYVRLPIRGGMAEISYDRTRWTGLHAVKLDARPS